MTLFARLRNARAPQWRLGPATEADAPALAAILSDWVADTPWMPRLHSRAEDLAFIARTIARTEVIVARDRAGRALGFLSRDGEDVPGLHVAARARGRGVGGALIGSAKGGRARLSLWTFQANTGARRFYARHGFREVATPRDDNEERLPDVQLLWMREQTP
ncbi:MAG: GNAT family N-acetyltransferase [Rhodobacteraceae bacterium]|nr:GNAT family N-acetyltransferase [Paracoccaceae bacterium]